MISIGLSMTFLIFPYDFMTFSWHFHGISHARSKGFKSLGRHVHGVHSHVFAAVLPAEPVAGGAAGSDSKLGENPKGLRNPAPIWDGWKDGWIMVNLLMINNHYKPLITIINHCKPLITINNLWIILNNGMFASVFNWCRISQPFTVCLNKGTYMSLVLGWLFIWTIVNAWMLI